jgi:hypothetical protein
LVVEEGATVVPSLSILVSIGKVSPMTSGGLGRSFLEFHLALKEEAITVSSISDRVQTASFVFG